MDYDAMLEQLIALAASTNDLGGAHRSLREMKSARGYVLLAEAKALASRHLKAALDLAAQLGEIDDSQWLSWWERAAARYKANLARLTGPAGAAWPVDSAFTAGQALKALDTNLQRVIAVNAAIVEAPL